MTYNHQIINDALNKYTTEIFKWQTDHEVFMSKSFQVYESGFFEFEVIQFVRDVKTGVDNQFIVCVGETLADAIDKINTELGGAA